MTASARIDVSDARVGTKKPTLRSNQETDEGKRCAARPYEFLDKENPIQGPGADSEEKHQPVSDIDTIAADSLKALDPEWPIREADISLHPGVGRKGPCVDGSELARRNFTPQRFGRCSHVFG
ncbi:MAG: hypothetical protein WAU67_02225, partial [Terracidiphilus sp.]